MEQQYIDYIQRWKQGLESGIRGKHNISAHLQRYIRNKYREECAECGWKQRHPVSGEVPVEIHHIDGRFFNNAEGNLTLLCPNCHSLTSTYRGRNVGNGRPERNKPL